MEPQRYAFGAAAAMAVLDPSILEQAIPAGALLDPLRCDAGFGGLECLFEWVPDV